MKPTITKPRVAFFGSPEFALPVLSAILEHFEVVLVVTQPDKPSGRGMKLTPPAVAAKALELGLPLSQPAKLKNNLEFAQKLRDSGADVAVTCAYGKILPASLLEIPPFGFLNVHTSLLPKYRGAAPIQWAVINGETETGVTVMQTDPGMDTGAILLQESIPISSVETVLELSPRLSSLGATMIVDALEQLGSLTAIPQDSNLATHARMLEKEDAFINWTLDAKTIFDRYRGLAGWPGSYFLFQGKRVKIIKMRPSNASGHSGQVLELGDGVTVAAASGALELLVTQPEGKPKMNALDWARGYQVKPGTQLEIKAS
jgi:methionyl-tRNA formyltransferase